MSRMIPTVRLAFVVAAIIFWGTSLSASPLGIDVAGNVISFDTSTGAGTLVGASGVSETSSLASNSLGVFYTVDYPGSGPRLDTINPNTGLATIGPAVTGLGAFEFLNGLAFSSSDVLFADSEDLLPGPGPVVTNLFTINTTTGAATSIGVIAEATITDLAFSPSGTLYAWDFFFGLRTVNTSTGAGTLVAGGLGTLPDIRALTFDTLGNLYGAGLTNFYSINPTTSVPTLIGATGFRDVRGLAFEVDAVPEPATLALLGLGAAGLGFYRRRRRV